MSIYSYFAFAARFSEAAFLGVGRDAAYGTGWYVTDLPPSTPTRRLLEALWQGNADNRSRTDYWLLLAAHDARLHTPDTMRPSVRFLPMCTGFRFMGDLPKPWIISDSPVYLLEAGNRQENEFGRTVTETLFAPREPAMVVPPYVVMVDGFSRLGRFEQRNLLAVLGTHVLDCDDPLEWVQEHHPEVVGLKAHNDLSDEIGIVVSHSPFGTVDFSLEDWTNLSDSLYRAGHTSAASLCAGTASEGAPDIAEAWLNRGASLSAQMSYSEAMAAYDRALRLRPDYHQAAINKAGLLVKLERFAEALDVLERPLVAAPDNVSGLNNQATALSRLGRQDESIAVYERALRIDQDLPEVWNGLGAVMMEGLRSKRTLSDADLATLARVLECVWRAVALRPSYGNPRRNLFAALDIALPIPQCVNRGESTFREILRSDVEAGQKVMTGVLRSHPVEIHPRYMEVIHRDLGLSPRQMDSIAASAAGFLVTFLRGGIDDEEMTLAPMRLLGHTLSTPLTRAGMTDVVLELAGRALRHADSAGERLHIAKTYKDCGVALRKFGAFDHAITCYEQAAVLYVDNGDRKFAAHTSYNRGYVYQLRGGPGDGVRARRAYGASLEIYEALKLTGDAQATRERLRELGA